MKASVTFREERKPLLKAKIPLSVVGLPFLSHVSAGDGAGELSMSLSTAFDSGPSLRLSYRPNDPANAFRLLVRTGLGRFGAPASSPLSFSAEFDLLPGSRDPRFFLRLAPCVGDFSIKKKVTSNGDPAAFFGRKKMDATENGESTDGIQLSFQGNGGTIEGSSASPESFTGAVEGLFSSAGIHVRSVFPLRKHALLSFTWGVRLPTKLSSAPISLGNLPVLSLSKMKIERVANDAMPPVHKKPTPISEDEDEVTMVMMQRLDALQSESGLLKKAVEELRLQMHGPGGFRKSGRPESVDGSGNSPKNVSEESSSKKKGSIGGGSSSSGGA